MSIIKHRCIKFKAPIDSSELEELRELLNRQSGIIDVTFNPRKRFMRVFYNLEMMNLSKIEKFLQQHRVRLCSSFWERCKRSYVNFTEQSEWENARASNKHHQTKSNQTSKNDPENHNSKNRTQD
ncbi:MAG: hypothetical protein GXO76_10725 [Calditrichaeota bacterium]|nr:hypothetical protein [Calditrichota bacterium]